MRAKQRREYILQHLISNGHAAVDDLATTVGVTPSTIRRDLAHLTSTGAVTRTYGGAVVATPPLHEQTLRERSAQHRREKDMIAQTAAGIIRDGETIILDAGTTTGRIAHHLRDRPDLTVVTSGLTAVVELAEAVDVTVIALGGELRHISQGFVGPSAELVLRRHTADRVFLGADGLIADRGICEASIQQTSLKELMARQAREIYVVADSSKIGYGPFDAWAVLDRPWTLITDDKATETQLEPFHALPEVDILLPDTTHTEVNV